MERENNVLSFENIMNKENTDAEELEKFEAIAKEWWDTQGKFKPLHDINPIRMGYISERVDLKGKRVLDVGCGGGILSEALTLAGAQVIGIDAADGPLKVAKLHSYESGIFPDYKNTTIEQLAIENDDLFDVVTCLEMLEHVPNPESVIYSCFKLLKPNGSAFFSTINRNPKSFLFAIIGAEHLLKLLPKGTHKYQKLIKPSELAVWCRKHNFSIQDISGMVFNPIFQTYKLSSDVDVNYIVHCKK